jgi:hypothetical protein
MTKCQYCNKLYEKKTGLRIHQMYCKDKKWQNYFKKMGGVVTGG